jgi:hypothetical protein
MSKRQIGTPKTRWGNNVFEDIKNMDVRNWKKVAQNRDSWKKVVEQTRTLYRLKCFVRIRITEATTKLQILEDMSLTQRIVQM